jgi:putative ABC transport system permease protein
MAGTTVRIQQAGVIEGLLDSSNSKTVALIPLDAVRAVPGAPTEPNAVLVFGHGVTQRALAAVAPTGAEVTTLGMVRGDIQDAPLSHVTRFAYLVAVVASAALTALAVILWLLLTAPSRTRALSLLGTLGLSSKEARRIATVELVPAAVTALLAGTAVGLTVPSLVGPAIDLTPFVGGSGRVRLSADPTTSAMLIAAFALLIALAAGAATTFSRRRRLGATLRQGEDR